MGKMMANFTAAASRTLSQIKHAVSRWEQQLAEVSWAMEASEERMAEEVAPDRYPDDSKVKEAMLGLEDAKERLFNNINMKPPVKRERPSFAVDVQEGDVYADKAKILNRLEELANHEERLDLVRRQGAPEELIEAARKVRALKREMRETALGLRDFQATVRDIVEELYVRGVRVPDGLMAVKASVKKLTLPTVSTRDYDVTRKYNTVDEVYFKKVEMGDGMVKVFLTNEKQQSSPDELPFGYVTEPPSKAEPELKVAINMW